MSKLTLVLTLVALAYSAQGTWVPASYDVRAIYPQCKHSLPYEGMCVATWALVFADALASRYCTATGSDYGNLLLSGQDILSCVQNPDGCYAFKLPPTEIIEHLQTVGVATADCIPYTSGYRAVVPKCSTACSSGSTTKEKFQRYKAALTSGAAASSETIQQIQYEIISQGPIVIEYPRSLLLESTTTNTTGETKSEQFGNLYGKIWGWNFDENSNQTFWVVQTAFGVAVGDNGVVDLPFPTSDNGIVYNYYRLNPDLPTVNTSEF